VDQPCKEFGHLQGYYLMGQDFIQRIIESRYNMTMARPIKKQDSKEENKIETSEDVLKVSDRCDRCGAQAFVMIKGSTGDLLFCGHHYDKIMNNPDSYTKMMSFMLEIVDERHKLVQNRLIGSHN